MTLLDEGAEQPAGAEVAGGDPAGDGEDPALGHPLLEDADDLLVVDLLAVEVALHQLVGVLGDLVHQFLAVFLGLGAEVVGDLDLGGVVAARALADEGLHVDQVDDAADVLFGPDRDLGGDDVGAEGALQRVERGEEVGALAVEHVDEDEAGQALVVGAAPEPLGVDLDPRRRVDHDDRGVGDAQRGDRVGDEARLARACRSG